MKHKHRKGVRFRLTLSLLIFTLATIAVLWLIQVVFLNDIYKGIKIRSVKRAAEGVRSVSSEDLAEYSDRLANQYQICTAFYDRDLNQIAGNHAGGECVVHRISSSTIGLFYNAALKSDGGAFLSYLPAEEIEEILRRSDATRRFFEGTSRDPFPWGEPRRNSSGYDCVLESCVTEDADGNEVFVLLSTTLVPVEPTVSVIRIELQIVVVLLLLLSIGLGYLLSRTISRPLVKLNAASKELASGKFDPSGIGGGYREVRELTDTLQYASEEIGKVDQLRRELIANVSHDLRTPLTLIAGYSEVMRDIPGENTPENLQVVIDETLRLTNLVNDMLDLSKMEAGMETLNREELDFTELVGSILQRYEKLVEQDGYQIRFEKDRDELTVTADRTKLSQVIYNLVNNAIHYCGEDKTVIVRQTVLADSVRLEVIDHGEGIEKDKLDEIWDRYYRIDKNHKSATVGSGLGLSIVKTALKLHAARYGVESVVGEGSDFWFELPLRRGDA